MSSLLRLNLDYAFVCESQLLFTLGKVLISHNLIDFYGEVDRFPKKLYSKLNFKLQKNLLLKKLIVTLSSFYLVFSSVNLC